MSKWVQRSQIVWQRLDGLYVMLWKKGTWLVAVDPDVLRWHEETWVKYRITGIKEETLIWCKEGEIAAARFRSPTDAMQMADAMLLVGPPTTKPIYGWISPEEVQVSLKHELREGRVDDGPADRGQIIALPHRKKTQEPT